LDTAVALSADGKRIASTSDDYMIWVWDATIERVIAGPFAGHTDSVRSVAFSPDGQRIASSSRDCTIRVWDTTGQLVSGPFTGHTYPASSVVSSPEAQQTASASRDGIEIHFTDQSVINSDGWIYGDEEKLILWIPELHRPCLHRPSTIWIAGEHETRLDFSKFVYGSNWATVYDHNLSG
jgi:WD40 repeat protein